MKMTFPMILTLMRIALIPVLVLFFYLPYAWAPLATAAVFILAAITDWLDGHMARRMDLMSDFGAFLDPVADKLMVATALLFIPTHTRGVTMVDIVNFAFLGIVVSTIVVAISQIVMVCDAAEREASRAHIAALARDHHQAQPDAGSTHARLDFGLYRLRWELHTEFITWTFTCPLKGAETGERVPDVIHGYAGRAVQFGLVREQREHVRHGALDLVDALAAPCPDRRADVMDGRDAALLEGELQVEIEVRRIHRDK